MNDSIYRWVWVKYAVTSYGMRQVKSVVIPGDNEEELRGVLRETHSGRVEILETEVQDPDPAKWRCTW